jgi:transposase-like protein
MIGVAKQRIIAMKKGTKKSQKSEALNQPVFPIAEFIREQLFSFVVNLGIEQLYSMLEEERTALCGDRYRHNDDRTAVRSGHVDGVLSMGGRRVTLKRPRVRSADGKSEIPLGAWEQFRGADPLTERAMEQMIVGVSTRKYDRSLETGPKDLKTSGTSKSAVSRRFIQGTQKKLDELRGRDLSGLNLKAIMIDGIHFADHVVLVALGIDKGGRKTILGLHQGATENSTACKHLLRTIIDRGVSSERAMLFCIDGSKALKKAIVDIWGELAPIQRCRLHKRRNVEDHLPKSMHASIQQSMKQAYSLKDRKKAKKALQNLANKLDKNHPGAAASLREGLDETLTVNGMNLPADLEKSLVVTNVIENSFSTVRTVSKRVKRWTGGTMVLRWAAAGLLEAEKGFQRIRGYKHMPKLTEALRKHEEKLGYGAAIDSVQKTG